MRIAILDPFSGIAGDMMLGALIDVGLDPEFVRALPAQLGLEGIRVDIRDVVRADIKCKKVDFEIPPQPHGRHLKHIREIVSKSGAPALVQQRADEAFTAITKCEAEIHGTTMEKVHLHEVGAVDAILDIVGSIWGFEQLGVERVFNSPLSVGDGTVQAAHGTLPVPAPATLRLLEGISVRPGPENSGELVTPTGAALVKVLSSGPPPSVYSPLRSGYGAGTKDFKGRANALRLVLGELDVAPQTEELVLLASDVDDMSPEYVAATADLLREAGALDVVLLPTVMKKGRAGTRIEVLCRPGDASRLEELLLTESSTIGVRRTRVDRRALPRSSKVVQVLGHDVSVKVVTLPDGRPRGKPEFADVQRVALVTGRSMQDIFVLAAGAAERA